MKMNWYRKLRERQQKRAIEKAQLTGIELAKRRAGILARIEWLNAAISVAERTNNEALFQTVRTAANDTLAEFDELNRDGIADVGRGFDLANSVEEKTHAGNNNSR
jgi:hypothetical protein